MKRPNLLVRRLVLVGVVGALVATPVGAHVNERFNHLWKRHIRPKLAAEGTINNPNNPVNWTRLVGVPADFADGDDETGVRGRQTLFVDSAFNSNPRHAALAECPAGTVPVGGGSTLQGDAFGFAALSADHPIPELNAWYGDASEINPTDSNWGIRVYVICVIPVGD